MFVHKVTHPKNPNGEELTQVRPPPIVFEGLVFASEQKKLQWFRKKNKRLVSIEKQLTICNHEDGVQSILFLYSANINEGRESFITNGPIAKEVAESPEGKAFAEKFISVMKRAQSKLIPET